MTMGDRLLVLLEGFEGFVPVLKATDSERLIWWKMASARRLGGVVRARQRKNPAGHAKRRAFFQAIFYPVMFRVPAMTT